MSGEVTLLTVAELASAPLFDGQFKRRTSAEVVARITEVYPGLQRRRFARTTFDAIRRDFDADERVDLGFDWFRSYARFVPDAYFISKAQRNLKLFEVEVTNRLSARKLGDIASCLLLLSLRGWDVELYRVDEYGRVMKEDWYRFVPT